MITYNKKTLLEDLRKLAEENRDEYMFLNNAMTFIAMELIQKRIIEESGKK